MKYQTFKKFKEKDYEEIYTKEKETGEENKNVISL